MGSTMKKTISSQNYFHLNSLVTTSKIYYAQDSKKYSTNRIIRGCGKYLNNQKVFNILDKLQNLQGNLNIVLIKVSPVHPDSCVS